MIHVFRMYVVLTTIDPRAGTIEPHTRLRDCPEPSILHPAVIFLHHSTPTQGTNQASDFESRRGTSTFPPFQYPIVIAFDLRPNSTCQSTYFKSDDVAGFDPLSSLIPSVT